MNLERCRKALAGFAASFAVPFAWLALSGAHLGEAIVLGVITGLITELVVYFVPNRMHGFNVTEIAAAMFKAAEDVAADHEGMTDDTPTDRKTPHQSCGQDAKPRRPATSARTSFGTPPWPFG